MTTGIDALRTGPTAPRPQTTHRGHMVHKIQNRRYDPLLTVISFVLVESSTQSFAGSVGNVCRDRSDQEIQLCHLYRVIHGNNCCVNKCRVHNYSTAETRAKKKIGRLQIACFKHDIKAQLQMLRSAPVA